MRGSVHPILVAALVLSGGCKSKSPPPTEAAPASAKSAAAAGANRQNMSCKNDERAMRYAPGLEKLGEAKVFKVRLISASPAPPIKGVNSWSMQVLDAKGGPVPGAKLEAHRDGDKVDPSMPDHGHDSMRSALITSNSGGTFTVDSLYFFMPGVWRTGLDVTAPDGRKDVVYFFFCVEG
jgi:hypothetical protein